MLITTADGKTPSPEPSAGGPEKHARWAGRPAHRGALPGATGAIR